MEDHHNNGFTYHAPDLWESAETAKLDAALVNFNTDFSSVPKGSTVEMPNRPGRKFASLNDIMMVIRPILAKHKLFIMQPIVGDRMLTIVKHESGQFRTAALQMIAWQGQGTNALQNLGGAISYLRRYALGAFLALASEEDDDGNSAGKLDTSKKVPTKPAAPALDESVVDAWQSKVSGCKVASDFENLSGELRDLGLDDFHPVKVFVKGAMSKRMKAVGIEFNREHNVFQPIEKPAPTEKQA
jgi:hypothetical protein